MPNRVIREAILDSEAYHALSVDARCLFVELILNADDYGLVPLGDLYLKRHTPTCEGKSAQAISGLLEQIAAQQMIVIYQSDSGSKFGCIPKFGNSPRSLTPKWPLPPEPLATKINEIRKKRSASVMQTQRRRSASAPETGTGTETGTETERKKEQEHADAPVDVAAQLFSFGVGVLTRDGKKPLTTEAAKSMIGLMRKTWPDETVLDALQASVGMDNPTAYARAVLRDKPTRATMASHPKDGDKRMTKWGEETYDETMGWYS